MRTFVIPGVSAEFLPPGLLATLLILPTDTYRPIANRLISGLTEPLTEDLDGETVRLLLAQELERSLEHSWRTYRLKRYQARSWVQSLLQQKVLETTQTRLMPCRVNKAVFVPEKFDDIFPDPTHIRLRDLLHATHRYLKFLSCVRQYCKHRQQFWDYLESRMLPPVQDIRLYLERFQDREECQSLKVLP